MLVLRPCRPGRLRWCRLAAPSTPAAISPPGRPQSRDSGTQVATEEEVTRRLYAPGRQLWVLIAARCGRPRSRRGGSVRRARRGHPALSPRRPSGIAKKLRNAGCGCAAPDGGPHREGVWWCLLSGRFPFGRLAGARRGASRLGYWAGGGLGAACTGAATARVAQAATRVLYLDGPRAATPPGLPGTGVTGPAGNPVAVSTWHGDLRYGVPVSARRDQGHAIKRARTFRAGGRGADGRHGVTWR